MGQDIIADLNILECSLLGTMCTQLRTLRTGSYAPEYRTLRHTYIDPRVSIYLIILGT